MVAKSFQKMEIIGEPYNENGRAYIIVKNKDTGKTRAVRWYTESEYAKLYPEETVLAASGTPGLKTHKEALGFDKGYITIFKGDVDTYQQWFLASNARYAVFWGWYVISTEEVPADLPAGIEPIRLNWEDVGREDGSLKGDNAIKSHIESLFFEPTPSKYQGKVGERLEIDITVTKLFKTENNFGISNMIVMKDAKENEYIWYTSAQSWPVGTRKIIRATVKAHSVYKNSQQTVLTRCIERK